MKKGQASRTAEGVAALRAVESLKPEDERVCYDPLAQHFLGAKYRLFGRSRFLTRLALWNAERRSPGVFGCLVGRTRYIDDCLKACIDDKIEQLVILGAGYDTRAYRFGELKEKVKVFEVDHPATQEVKIEKVSRMLGSLPGNVVYVPIDFEKERLDKKLFESGYDRSLKTLFIWEGVTMYLTAESVDRTLAFIAGYSGKGSRVVFDYLFESAIDGTSGTVLACDEEILPAYPPLLYNDARATPEAAAIARAAGDSHPAATATSGLAKTLWLKKHLGIERAWIFLNQADWLTSLLGSALPRTDYHNALKMGFDIVTMDWPAWVEYLANIDFLPQVVAPGAELGWVSPPRARLLGLNTDCMLRAGTVVARDGQGAEERWAIQSGRPTRWAIQ